MSRQACLLLERTGRWARQLRLARPEVDRCVREARVWSEVERLLEEDPRRLVLVALEREFPAERCRRRLLGAAFARRRWPECRFGFLLDPGMPAWYAACQELDGSLLASGLANCRQLADRMIRFAAAMESRQAPDHDPRTAIRDRLPWS